MRTTAFQRTDTNHLQSFDGFRVYWEKRQINLLGTTLVMTEVMLIRFELKAGQKQKWLAGMVQGGKETFEGSHRNDG